MRTILSLLFGFAMILVATGTRAQEAEPGGQPAAFDQSLVMPASRLDEGQVKWLQARLMDFAQLARYREENARLPARRQGRVVFLGDSTTEGWGHAAGSAFFPGEPWLNRGISGQTSAQMLLRFRQDVIDLHPDVVVILAGTNDIAGNNGPESLDAIEGNLRSMVELARANRIRVVLASVLPASAFPWRPGYKPAAKIRALNDWTRRYAHDQGLAYLDYYSAMANAEGGLDPKFAEDGVHPTAAGYTIMAPLAQQAIREAFKARR